MRKLILITTSLLTILVFLFKSQLLFSQDIPAQVGDDWCENAGTLVVYAATKRLEQDILKGVTDFVIVSNQTGSKYEGRIDLSLSRKYVGIIQQVVDWISDCKEGPIPISLQDHLDPSERILIQLRLQPVNIRIVIDGNEWLNSSFPDDCEVTSTSNNINVIAGDFNVPDSIKNNAFLLLLQDDANGDLTVDLYCFDHRELWTAN